MNSLLYRVAFVILVPVVVGCQSPNTAFLSDFLSAEYKAGRLNGNVLVTQDGETVFELSYGYADAAKEAVLTGDYRFGIGSIYKEFPAVAIMQLQGKGLLNLEDKISSYLKFLPDWAQKISGKNLLQYSSGLPRIKWDQYFNKGLPIDEDVLLKDIIAIETRR